MGARVTFCERTRNAETSSARSHRRAQFAAGLVSRWRNWAGPISGGAEDTGRTESARPQTAIAGSRMPAGFMRLVLNSSQIKAVYGTAAGRKEGGRAGAHLSSQNFAFTQIATCTCARICHHKSRKLRNRREFRHFKSARGRRGTRVLMDAIQTGRDEGFRRTEINRRN